MKLTRRKRIALELLGPPFIGATLPALFFVPTALGGAIMKGDPASGLKELGTNLGIVYAVAYMIAGVQSVLYTVIMEWCFSRGIDPRSWRSVGLSTLLGFFSGAAICLGYGFQRSDVIALWVFFGGTGLAVGLILGFLIKGWSAKPAGGV